jgi:hypothetical protein
MNTKIGVIIKVFVFSLLISWAIKYFGPYLSLSPNNINVLIAVLTPTIIMGSLLLWRFNDQKIS